MADTPVQPCTHVPPCDDLGAPTPRGDAGRYRVGRSQHRTLYDGNELFGMVDTPEQAAHIVEALNARQPLADAIRDAVDNVNRQYTADLQAAYKEATLRLADNLNDVSSMTWTCEAADELGIDREAAMALIYQLKTHLEKYGRPLSRDFVAMVKEPTDG